MLRTLVVVASLLRTSSAACPSVVAHDCVCLESARAVHCIGKNLTTVPDDLPSLLHLTVVDNSIEMIVTPIRYGSLTSLVLDRNRISYIADRMFAKLASLTKLSLVGNQLSQIGANTFYGLESLVFLILDHNPLFRLDRGPFSSGHLRSLRILKVSRCSIYALNRGALAELPSLGFLDLSHNLLNELPDFTEVGSSGLTQLECMDLSSNRIVGIGEDRCRSLSSLARLELANNSIGELRPRSLGGLSTSLTLLDLSHNRLADLSSALANAITLTDLLLPYNNLSALDDGSIPWASLQSITLHDNPWNCSCAAAWLVRQPLVSQWNVNATIRCASPSSVAGRNMLDTASGVFANCSLLLRSNVQKGRRSPVVVVIISVAVCLLLVGIVTAFVFMVRNGVFIVGRRRYQPSELSTSIISAAPPYRRV